jgi:hypothetical protein
MWKATVDKVDALFRTSAEVCSSCTTATPLYTYRYEPIPISRT